MAGRSGRRRVDPGSPLVDLDAVFADDAFVDAIASQAWGSDPASLIGAPLGRGAAGSARGSLLTVDPLTELLTSWRQELAIAPIPAPPRALGTTAATQHRPPTRSRTLRPALAIAAAIAALLVGAASIGSKDVPRESPLFALTQVLWPSRADSVASADQVDAILVEARFAIQAGRTQDAQLALLRATVELGNVDVVDGKDDKQERVAAMWIEVAPQPLPTRTQTGESVSNDGPSTPGTWSPADSATVTSSQAAILAAQSAAGTVGAGQLDALAPLIVPPVPSTVALQAALGSGSPSSPADPTPAGGVAVTEVAAPAVTDAAIVPVPTVEPPTSAVLSVPSPPTAPVGPPVVVPASDPPSATEQSPPAPTPSEPSPTVEASTPNGAGAFTSSETAAPIPLDPAAAATG